MNLVVGIVCLMGGAALIWVGAHPTNAASPWGVWQQVTDAIGTP